MATNSTAADRESQAAVVNRVHSGRFIIDASGFGYSTGSTRNREYRTETIDEVIVIMRGLIRRAREENPFSGDYLEDFAERFEALDDWLSSGRRRLPKSWATDRDETSGEDE
jgi:hypothetical protein